jgi:hypothetical protein
VIFLPQQPNLAGMLRQQILARKSSRHGKALGSFTHQHHVAGVGHHSFCHQRNIFDIAHAADRSRAAGRPVHAAGVELDNAFLIGQSAVANACVLRIVLRALHHAQGRIERIPAALEESKGILDIFETVVRGNYDGTLVRTGGAIVLCASAVVRRRRSAMRADPVATAPNTEVLTKSRREKVIVSSTN